jgi:hypothetical protein
MGLHETIKRYNLLAMRKKAKSTQTYREVQASERAFAAVTQLRSKVDPGHPMLLTHLKWSAEVLNELARLLQERLDVESGVTLPKNYAKANSQRNHRSSRSV